MAKAVKKEKLSLQDMLKKLEKDFGKGAVITGNEIETYEDVISTGSLSLDIATGIGGLPISLDGKNGKIIEIFGWESSGKSTVVQTIIANAQKKGIKCVLVDGENSLDEKYSTALGVNLQDLLVIQLDETAGEGAYDKAKFLVETGEIGLVVIDSYNSLQPKKIVDEGIGDQTMGLHARMMGKVVSQINNLCTATGCTYLFVGQLREKIGVMFGSPETTQGGNALKFYAHMRMQVSRSLTVENSVMDGTDKMGNLTKVNVIKNKMAAPFKKAEFNIMYGTGIDKMGELIELAHDYEVGKKYGESFTYDGTKYKIAEFKQLLGDNPSLYDDVRNAILKETKVKKIDNTIADPDTEEKVVNLVTEKLIEEGV